LFLIVAPFLPVVHSNEFMNLIFRELALVALFLFSALRVSMAEESYDDFKVKERINTLQLAQGFTKWVRADGKPASDALHTLTIHVAENKSALEEALRSNKHLSREQIKALSTIPNARENIILWLDHLHLSYTEPTKAGNAFEVTAPLSVWEHALNTSFSTYVKFVEEEENRLEPSQKHPTSLVRAERYSLPVNGGVWDSISHIHGTTQFPVVATSLPIRINPILGGGGVHVHEGES
jgi:hypothetical protein